MDLRHIFKFALNLFQNFRYFKVTSLHPRQSDLPDYSQDEICEFPHHHHHREGP